MNRYKVTLTETVIIIADDEYEAKEKAVEMQIRGDLTVWCKTEEVDENDNVLA